ncbi:MAG: phosphoribosylamine--glycine ligase [Oscillospiraceae bacterium]|nr:phosphoribosylamine--glycine ligase [Oscillospiraceae bacterium]
MNILVIGSGGREHAICWALKKSPRVDKLYCAPGNGGISTIAKCVNIDAVDIDGIVRFSKDNAIDFVMVAPEEPLSRGLVDALESAGIRAFGPRKDAAVIESSKIFSKNLMKKYSIPTAEYETFTDADSAKAYIREKGAPIVIKADGLALGKGVTVAMDLETALQAVDEMMLDRKFGDGGGRVVIEEYMTGPEVTVLAFTDGKTIVPMLSSQDHKRAFTGDLGPNTGGMGAFCPSPNYTDDIAEICMSTIFRPTVDALANEGRVFKGVLYFGLMLTPSGPRVIEYNCRFGDPETQAVVSMLKTDLLDIFEAVVDERLSEIDIEWRDGASCCVVMASGGYPEKYDKGFTISGLDDVPGDITVFHAGTAKSGADFITNGGRILGVTAIGESLTSAAKRAYEGVACIAFEKAHYRTDIGV